MFNAENEGLHWSWSLAPAIILTEGLCIRKSLVEEDEFSHKYVPWIEWVFWFIWRWVHVPFRLNFSSKVCRVTFRVIHFQIGNTCVSLRIFRSNPDHVKTVIRPALPERISASNISLIGVCFHTYSNLEIKNNVNYCCRWLKLLEIC